MARRPIQTQDVEQLRPQAAAIDTYVQPQRSSLHDLAAGLGKIDAPLREFLGNRAEQFKKEEDLRGEAAFYNDNAAGLAEGVRTGKIPAQFSPAFVRGWKGAEGNVAGNNLQAKFEADFAAWEGKNSDDPAAFETFFKEWAHGQIGTDDPAVLAGVLPHIRAIHDAGTRQFIEYRHKQTYEGGLTAGIAGANQDLDAANAAGLASEKGTDYPTVFKAIDDKRSAWIKTGGRPEDFDKAMTDAMSAKILSTRDPGLVAWFSQKVPGEDYTYGDTPYGSAVKATTIDALEVIARRNEAEDYTKTTRENEARKDGAQKSAIELLSKDPSAVMPDGLLAEGSKYDPQFKVHIEEWRKSLGAGFSDERRMKSVYAAILDGDTQAVQKAMKAGVFGRTEDLTAAYAFQKSFEGNKDRIDEVLKGAAAKGITDALSLRTKNVDLMTLDPVTGLSNEGFEATYDFKRMVQEWVINNPNATPTEIEEQVGKIGKTLLDRVQAPSLDEPGVYDRPAELGKKFDNPYSDGTGVVDQSPPADPNAADKAGEVQDFLGGLEPAQKTVLEQQAKERGVSVEDLANEMLDGGAAKGGSAETGSSAKPISYTPGNAREQGFTPEQASAFLDEAMTAQAPAAGSQSSHYEDPRVASLLDLIRKHEAGGNYNAVYGNAGATRDLSKFSLNQILGMQAVARRRGVASTAIGGGQFIYKTLRGLKEELGLSGSEKFTPKLQDRLMVTLLERHGLSAFLASNISKRQFALGLSQEWAALPNPSTGRSFYAGDGLNASSVHISRVYQELGLLQEASFTPSPQGAATPTPTGEPGAIPTAYSKIPEKDSLGLTDQRARFMEWNPDPVGNEAQTLSTIDPTLANVVRRAKELNPSFVVGSGARTKEQQAKAVKWGWSKKADSDHLDGSATDLWPLDGDGAVVFDKPRQLAIVKAMKQAAKELGVELDIGADWKRFKDLPHFAIKRTIGT